MILLVLFSFTVINGITKQFLIITSGSIITPTPSTHTSNFPTAYFLFRSSSYKLPSTLHQGPILEFQPIILLITTEFY